ncbi:MAG TPA: sigma-70 family RNA polymerase sigma factor [Emcibacteraceae bacterium]|nr:sigma-70 family RNA polymerase sigma factor [Emcibacteraceae bacterium]
MFENTALINEMDRLKRFAYHLTNNSADAEDLVQSAILRAIEKKHLFEKGTNLFSWTSKIMYNMFVSNYRRKVKFESQYDPESYIERESVEASQEIKMEVKEIDKAMKSLSDEHREILIMVCIQGMQYAQVSEALDIPIGTVRSRLSRARENLQNELDKPAVPNGFRYADHDNRIAA